MSTRASQPTARAKVIPLGQTGRGLRSAAVLRRGVAPQATVIPAPLDAHGYTQSALALEYVMPSGVPAIPRPPLRLITTTQVPPPTQRAMADNGDAFFDRQRTPEADLPEATRWTARLTQAIVEVWLGRRPVHQLARWMDNHVYAELLADSGNSPDSVVPTNSARAFLSKAGVGHIVRSVHIGRPSAGVIEASAVVSGGVRSRAIALRLEGWDGRWLCTALHVL